MIRLHRNILFLALSCGLLAGCAFDFSSNRPADSGGVRAMIAVDGTRIDVDDPIENGRALLLTGQYGLAVAQLSRIVNDEPQNLRALSLLAEAYGRLHRFDLADRYHAEALALDPNSVVTLNNWGYSYLVRGEKARAIGLLERAAAIKSDQPVVAANLQLAIGPIADAGPVNASLPVAADIGDVLISDHVTMVRRSGKLVRLAPGVQLLVTEATEPVSPTAPHARAADPTVAVPYIAARIEERVPDSRTLLFRALFRLMEAPAFEALPDPDLFASTAGVNVTAP
jgi:tetratricopeptide (TPR) repeat protein